MEFISTLDLGRNGPVISEWPEPQDGFQRMWDKHGLIQVCDLMIVASHYGEQPKKTTTTGDSLFVSPSGRDSNSGTVSSPFATLSKAISIGIIRRYYLSTWRDLHQFNNNKQIGYHYGTIIMKNYNCWETSTRWQFSSKVSNVMIYGINFSNSLRGIACIYERE